MEIEIKEDINKELEEFFKEEAVFSSFLESKSWFDLQKSLERKTFVVFLKDKDKIVLASIVIKLDLKYGKSYLYSPHGPVLGKHFFIDQTKIEEYLKTFIKKIREIAKKEKSVFYRIDPKISIKSPKGKIFSELLEKVGFSKSEKEVQPKTTLILDITKSEDELLKEMHGKTRYNIRLSERKGVTIKKSTDPKEIDTFYKIADETQERDKFFIHEKQYYRKQLEILAINDSAALFFAYLDKKPIAANLVTFHKDTATYLHGASSNENRNVMAPHLLQWEQILEAKKRGMKYYDFWGIAPEDEPDHSWSGITRFKKGFGGEVVAYVGTYDLVLSKAWYRLYNTFSK